MKIKIVSDLHLEFSPLTINNVEDCDVLILAGDIVTVQDLHEYPIVSEFSEARLGSRQRLALRYREFFSAVTNNFKDVIYVPGNHEYYKGKWHAGTEYLRDECSKYSNLHFLENDTVNIDDKVFIGGALWTDMNKQDPVTLAIIKDSMNDFSSIRNDKRSFSALRPIDTVKRHIATRNYFTDKLAEYADNDCIVVSHHSPTHQSIATQYLNDGVMNGGFVSNMDDFILDHPQIKLWVHGHTHTAFDYMLGDTHIVCNPRGYETYNWTENPGFDPDKIIEL